MIAAEKTNYPVAVMCRVLGVNRTAFHNWERRAPSDRALSDAWLTERIKRIHEDSRGVYGAPRIHAELRMEHDIRAGRKRVARLMKAAGISGIRPRKRWRTTIRIPGITPATDLVERDFSPAAPNVLWVADITYLRTGEGWLYLAAVQDAYSRQIVGWSMATHMRAPLVVDALQMALARRRPGPGLIHHSDQGGQYVSLAFGRAAREAGISVSMGSPRRRLRQRRRRDVLRHASRRSSSTAAAGHRGSSCSPPCSSTSRRSTTASAATPPSACSHQPPTNNYDSRRWVVEINRWNNNNQQQHQRPGVTQTGAGPASPDTSAPAQQLAEGEQAPRRGFGELRGIRFRRRETCNEVGAVIADVGGEIRKRARRVAAGGAGLGWVSIFASLARRRGRSNPTDRRHGGCESWC